MLNTIIVIMLHLNHVVQEFKVIIQVYMLIFFGIDIVIVEYLIYERLDIQKLRVYGYWVNVIIK